MSDMIQIASGFQYSVNIAYDLHSDDKLKNFIPTTSSIELLEEILLSTQVTSTERARILIGAYGKGKSHIVLMILSMLMKKDRQLFVKVMPRLDENPRLRQLVDNYYESNNKILPVIISGSNTSLTQAFLLALQRTLKENELDDVMPDTNYQAAIRVIERWQQEFPDTFEQFEKAINTSVDQFIDALNDFSIEAYEKFERVYPSLTAGSVFNPFLGFDVVELYESVLKELKKKGYTGIYVIYDEFSKFLEANISEASVSDTKMLQDFAEKCNRSGEDQLHLMLISHKEIANYIDKLPKQKTDGWRGVSERFKHIHLNNNFTQTYEIISSVILKDEEKWNHFKVKNAQALSDLESKYSSHLIFSDIPKDTIKTIIEGCYPLHPISTFILPRLSERVAQNERTLFTFLSADGVSTLSSFLKDYQDDEFKVITPDMIYDYFAPLFEKEVYAGSLHDFYMLTKAILVKLDEASLEAKIVKCLSLIYILEQFEVLTPTKDEIAGIFSIDYATDEIDQALTNLIEKKYVIYLKRSNGFLRLKETSGVNIRQMISDTIEKQRRGLDVKQVLNNYNFDKYIYPSGHNDTYEMTRYFAFEFIDDSEVGDNINWSIKSENNPADGIVYGILLSDESRKQSVKDALLKSSQDHTRFVFVLPNSYKDMENSIREFNAIMTLRNQAVGDRVLFDEYEVVYDDLRDIVNDFIATYTHPEYHQATYIQGGTVHKITRKASFSALLSTICNTVYNRTPVIVNESVNRNQITTIARKSRDKIVAALLRNDLDYNLGFTGYGQEVSMMRSTLLRTGVLNQEDGLPRINLNPDNTGVAHVLSVIIDFLQEAKTQGSASFSQLYDQLTKPEYHIGMRKGTIPIYIAAVFHVYKKEIFLTDAIGEMPLTVDALLQIEANPANYSLSYVSWDQGKEAYITRLEEIFNAFVIQGEKRLDTYGYVARAMRRWYMSLPKYSKEIKKRPDGQRIDRTYSRFIQSLKKNIGSYELLFDQIPSLLGYKNDYTDELTTAIETVKDFYDHALEDLKSHLIDELKKMFVTSDGAYRINEMSLSSVIKDWCDQLDQNVFDQLFTDGTEKCLKMFKEVGHDEFSFIESLSKFATDLRLEDWNDTTIREFIHNLKGYKTTAEEFHSKEVIEAEGTHHYQLTYIDDEGHAVTKRFEKVEESRRGKLLYNKVVSAVDAMGRSVSDQEKRQILMEVLKKLC